MNPSQVGETSHSVHKLLGLNENHRSGSVSLIGLPNAGKSRLFNTLCDYPLAAVSPKAQTTRKRQLGVITRPEFQMVLVDAPGAIRADVGLNHFLQEEFEKALFEADAILLALNPDAESRAKLEVMCEVARQSPRPLVVAITKLDECESRPELMRRGLAIEEMCRERGWPVVWLSCLKRHAGRREELLTKLSETLPEGPPYYAEDWITLSPMREIAAERIREKCFRYLSHEVPYQLAIDVRKFTEGPSGVRIDAEVIVAKANQKKLVIGEGGQKLKSIGMAARLELEKVWEGPVHLKLTVKVREQWHQKESWLKRMGFDSNA